MKLDQRVAALLVLVDQHREARCRELLDAAAAEARALLAGARRGARTRVHAAIAEERAAFAARVGAAQARLATRARMARQRRVQALLAEGWQRLADALTARWSEAAGRRRWVEAALAQALAALPARDWIVSGPAAWSEGERGDATTWLAQHEIAATFATDPAIDAGVRVASGGIVLDATRAGLLADRRAVEGRLLHFLEEPAA